MRPRIAPLAVMLALVTTGAATGVTAAPGQEVPPQPNPCLGPQAPKLRCPDLQMGVPGDMYAERTGKGRVLLRATNNVKSRGKGPVMFRGRRTGREEMSARQHIY